MSLKENAKTLGVYAFSAALLVTAESGIKEYIKTHSHKNVVANFNYHARPVQIIHTDKKFGQDRYSLRIGNDELTGQLTTDDGVTVETAGNEIYFRIKDETFSLADITKLKKDNLAKPSWNGIELVVQR